MLFKGGANVPARCNCDRFAYFTFSCDTHTRKDNLQTNTHPHKNIKLNKTHVITEHRQIKNNSLENLSLKK